MTTITDQIWAAMTDEERYAQILRNESARDQYLVSFKRPPLRQTGPTEWANMTHEQRRGRNIEVECQLNDIREHAFASIREAISPVRPQPQPAGA